MRNREREGVRIVPVHTLVRGMYILEAELLRVREVELVRVLAQVYKDVYR